MMTMRKLLVLALWFSMFAGTVLATSHVVGAEQLKFALSRGESLTVGTYAIEFKGLKAGAPSYDVSLAGGAVVAQFPSSQPAPNRTYVYEGITIETTSVTPDGTRATGVVRTK
jgi:hypothetical protein